MKYRNGRRTWAPTLALWAAAASAWGQAQSGDAPTSAPDLAALIGCERDARDFLALTQALHDPLRAVALGWRPLPQRNLFLSEYALVAPIRVFGHETRHIALSADNIVAVLDLPDPRALAGQLDLETLIDTPQKAMFGRELRSDERLDPISGATRVESVILNVANVDSHPGQTLAGCSYSIENITESSDDSTE